MRSETLKFQVRSRVQMSVRALLRHLLNLLNTPCWSKWKLAEKSLSCRDRNEVTADQQELNKTKNNSDRHTNPTPTAVSA